MYFEQKTRKRKRASVRVTIFSSGLFVFLPSNSKIIHQHTSIRLPAPYLSPTLIHPEVFQYILNYAHLVILVVEAASQVSKQEAGKKCGKHSNRVGLNDEKQGEGDMRRTLLKLAWRRHLFWLQRFQTNSEMRTPSQTLILILSRAGVQVFLAWCTGAIAGLLVTGLSWEGLCGGKIRRSRCGHPRHCRWLACYAASLPGRAKWECNFWMTKLSSFPLHFVILCQNYRSCKFANTGLQGEGSGF